MADRSDPENILALERLNESTRRLLHQVRATTAPPEHLAEAAAALDRVSDRLAPFAHPGPFNQGRIDGTLRKHTDASDFRSMMPYSPVSGFLNPIAAPTEFTAQDGSVSGRAVFPVTYTGPPQSVHGGLVAATFDELLASAVIAKQMPGRTGTLTIRYRELTPIGKPVEMEAHHAGRDGRKVFAQGEMRAGGRVTAEAEGVFVLAENAEP
jgi:acyl-coenzyme A thioesterase PaaI-like protein